MKTRILITIGDVNGIGPEIILKTLANARFTKRFDITVLAPVKALSYYSKRLNINLNADNFNIIPLADFNFDIKPGIISSVAGFISGLAVKTAVELCLNNEYDAIVTAPISKKALNLGGFRFDGHTEMLGKLGKARETCMMMLSDKINMGFATTHPPIKNVAGMINRKLLNGKLMVCLNALKNDLSLKKPAAGVLGLNPHAGDEGLIGDEELKIIKPVIKNIRNRNKGIRIEGPFSPDAFFASGIYRKFDMTFAMYHDQGFIPFKMLAGHQGTNFTAGLNFVRTSPDHGTAFDIAGKGIANEQSLAEALTWADKIYKNRIQGKN